MYKISSKEVLVLSLYKYLSPEQIKTIANAIIDRVKLQFVTKKTYESQIVNYVPISEYEQKIAEMQLEIDDLIAYKAKVDEIIDIIDVNPDNNEDPFADYYENNEEQP